MAKPDLYICHTPYQLMVDIVRAMRSGTKPGLVIAHAVPNAGAVQKRIRALGVFNEVRVFDEAGCVLADYRDPFGRIFLQHWREKRRVEDTGFSIYPPRYENIYIHNDWSMLGRYLQDLGAKYILCEDTFASTLWEKHPLLDEQRAAPDFAKRQKYGQGYLFWGDYRGCVAVETENAEQCALFPDKKVEHSKAALFAKLTEAEKKALRSVFITQALPGAECRGATLLLTRSFVVDGTLRQEEQNEMVQAVAARYAAEGKLFIKAHPRDLFDYKRLFPNAIVLDRTMPGEILNFALPFRFARAVAVQSTVLNSFLAADEKISLTLEEALALTKEGKA